MYWSTVLANTRLFKNSNVLFCAVLGSIKIRCKNSISLGPTEIELTKFGGEPTGRARTWIRFNFETDARLKQVTYNIKDAIGRGDYNVVRVRNNRIFGPNGELPPEAALNFNACVNRRTKEVRHLRQDYSVVSGTYRGRQEGNPCEPKESKISDPLTHGSVIQIKEAVPAVVEEFHIEPVNVSAENYERLSTIIECGEIHHGESEKYTRRLTMRYLVAWENKLGITPTIMWRGMSYVETIYTLLMDQVKSLSPGETFLVSYMSHGINAGAPGLSSFSADNGFVSTRALAKIYASAAEGVRIVQLNESCENGSSVFTGGYTIIDSLDTDDAATQSAITSEAHENNGVLRILEKTGKSKIEKELDEDGSQYTVPTFSHFTWETNSVLSFPTQEVQLGVLKRLSELNGNNKFVVQLSSSPWNTYSWFILNAAKPFLGSLTNIWIGAEAEYEKYLETYPDSEYIDEDIWTEESGKQPRPLFKYTGVYSQVFESLDYLCLDPWLGINQEALNTYLTGVCGLDKIEDRQYIKGFSFEDWFRGAGAVAHKLVPRNKPTLTVSDKLDKTDDALGDYSKHLIENEE